MKYPFCNNILTVYINSSNIAPSASWGPQLSPKGIRAQEACVQLKELLSFYPAESIIAVRFHYTSMKGGKVTWYIEVKGRTITDILKKELGLDLKIVNNINREQLKKLMDILNSDPYRLKSEKLEDIVINSLKSKKIYIDG